MPFYIADHKDQEALGDLICSVTVGGVDQSRMRHDGQEVIVPLVDDEMLLFNRAVLHDVQQRTAHRGNITMRFNSAHVAHHLGGHETSSVPDILAAIANCM